MFDRVLKTVDTHDHIVAKRHCVKSVSIRSYSGSHFPAFGLNTKRYGVEPCNIQAQFWSSVHRTPRISINFFFLIGWKQASQSECSHLHWASATCFQFWHFFRNARWRHNLLRKNWDTRFIYELPAARNHLRT